MPSAEIEINSGPPDETILRKIQLGEPTISPKSVSKDPRDIPFLSTLIFIGWVFPKKYSHVYVPKVIKFCWQRTVFEEKWALLDFKRSAFTW